MIVGVLGRDWWLTRSLTAREDRMMTEFPVVADLLALAVVAGEAPAAALARVGRLVRGELCRDLDGALQEFTELMRRIDARPLPNRTDRRPVTEAWAMLGVATPLYDRGYWPVLRQAIAQALEGDGTTLITTADILIGRRPDGTS